MGLCESNNKESPIPKQLANSPENQNLIPELANKNATDNPPTEKEDIVNTLSKQLAIEKSKGINGIVNDPNGNNIYNKTPYPKTDNTITEVKCAVENIEPLGHFIDQN